MGTRWIGARRGMAGVGVCAAVGAAGVAAALVSLAGCAAAPTATVVEAPAGRYEAAFEGAKDVLREHGFELERVDAREGVITTRARSSSGLATPWVDDESGLGEEFEGLFNDLQRRATVRFAPVSAPPEMEGAGGRDLRAVEGAMTVSVEVVVERVQRPGRQPTTATIRLTGLYEDADWRERRLQPRHVETLRKDEALAARLAERLGKAWE